MKQHHGLKIVVALGVFLIALYTLRPTWLVLSQPQDFDKPISEQRRANYIKDNPNTANKAVSLGLDLAGGTHIIVEIDDSKLSESDMADIQERCLEILRNRIDKFGVSEPVITKSGSRRIVAELAGVDAEVARRLIGSTALLEFKLVGMVEDFKTTLDKIDNHMKRQAGLNLDTSEQVPDSVRVVKDIFGTVVGESEVQSDSSFAEGSAMAGDSNSLKAADSSGNPDESVDSFRSRPFGSLLVGMPGGGVGVRVENLRQAKKILNSPDIRALIPKRYMFLWGRSVESLQSGKLHARELFFLNRRSEMTGKYIADAQVQRSPSTGELEVGLEFKDRGPREFARVTGANVKRQLAIVLDSVVYSAPVIQGKITQGRAVVTGIGDFDEAKLLSTTLRAGSLPASMNIAELRSVGPTLGRENIEKGIQAMIVGLLAVILFMILYYLGAGLVAVIALVLNLVIIGAVLSMLHATLTLPGIAGVILTIGMAVDANVIIFERIKEELGSKRSVLAAIDAGYKRAFSTIFDSNVTTFGTALILYSIGSGPIKGFGLTLMIGIGASMFTALFITRLVFDVFYSKVSAQSLSIGQGLSFLKNHRLNVITKGRLFATASIIVIVVSIGAVVGSTGFNWSIDFTGGNVYIAQFKSNPDISAIRAGVEQAGLANPKIRAIGTAADKQVMISLEKSPADTSYKSIITGVLGDEGRIVGEESVGPTIGQELKWDAIQACFWALILIVLYIWVRFGQHGLGFGLGAVVALLHDVLITLGIYGLLGFMGLEIGLTFVAATLTIVGYSLNDTIVVFDRVRENIEISGRQGFASKVNDAINQSLSRTVITSITTLFVVVVLAVLGGQGTLGFAVAMIIGVVVGTYSSVAIAAPFVVWWAGRTRHGIAGKVK